MKIKKERVKLKKVIPVIVKEERQRKFLERLGFVQLMFDFYTAPVDAPIAVRKQKRARLEVGEYPLFSGFG